MATRPRHSLVPDDVTESNRRLDRRLRRVAHMDLKRWKLIRGSVIGIAVMAFAAWAIAQGAPPGSTALIALVIVAALNGMDLMELAAMAHEARTGGPSESPSEDSTD
jgi:uncharacterized membrane protein YccC